MLVEPPIWGVIVLNILAWLAIQLGLAWWMTRLPIQRFNPRGLMARIKSWENKGRIYERLFAIKSWKDHLPDAGPMFRDGFAKAGLKSGTRSYYERFIIETWRGELTHWLALLAAPIFCIWNPWWGVVLNFVVAVAINLPCVLAQRYNRARFERIISLLDRK